MAEGIDAIILDVKTGDGAFMKKFEDSKALAEAMVRIGRGMGKKVSALITDMEQRLGRTVGNALEVKESVETLRGHGPKDLESLSLELAAWMLHLGGIAPGLDAARTRVRDALASGAGLRKFQEVIGLQGGDPRVGDDTSRLPQARETIELRSEAEGRVAGMACGRVGRAARRPGAGRETVVSRSDPAGGVVLPNKFGDPVGQAVFAWLGDTSNRLLQFSFVGSQFVFGKLGTPGGAGENIGFIFAFQVLPTIIFIAALFAILYYVGAMQVVVKLFAQVMTRLMGASGAESLNVAASIFMGQTEAPLTIRPYLNNMTQSELMCVMTSGIAHVNGGIMATYIAFGVEAKHLLAAVI